MDFKFSVRSSIFNLNKHKHATARELNSGTQIGRNTAGLKYNDDISLLISQYLISGPGSVEQKSL
jgi:hypothetical protein